MTSKQHICPLAHMMKQAMFRNPIVIYKNIVFYVCFHLPVSFLFSRTTNIARLTGC